MSVQPRSTSNTSTPSLLRSLQVEWDAAMMEMHELKVQNSRLQQDLSTALYQHDAACRVVARLMEEKRDLQHELERLRHQKGTISPQKEVVDIERQDLSFQSPGFQKYFTEVLTSTYEILSKGRKKRKMQKQTTNVHQFSHIEDFETPYLGISHLCLVQPSPNVISHIVVAGKSRGTTLYTFPGMQSLTTWPVKQFKVGLLSVLTHDAQNPVLLMARKNEVSIASTQGVLSTIARPEAVIGIDAHPSGKFFVTLTAGNAVELHHSSPHALLYQIQDAPPEIRIVKFHPDGMMLALVSQQHVHMFHVLKRENIAKINCFETVSGLCFSENGYHMATAHMNGYMRIWDLRDQKVAFEFNNLAAISSMKFDGSGMNLAVAWGDENQSIVELFSYQLKEKIWILVERPQLNTNKLHPVSDMEWGLNTSSLMLVSSESKSISFYDEKVEEMK